MKINILLLAVGICSGSAAFAQTTPASSTSTASGTISGNGATTAGSVPASVGPNEAGSSSSTGTDTGKPMKAKSMKHGKKSRIKASM